MSFFTGLVSGKKAKQALTPAAGTEGEASSVPDGWYRRMVENAAKRACGRTGKA